MPSRGARDGAKLLARGPSASPDSALRAKRLLSRMTLAQKVGQMTQAERLHISPAEVRDFHIGSVLSGGGSAPGGNRPSDWVAMNDEYWAASMSEEDGRTPVPLLYGVDAVHGSANVLGATVFPHNIGLGAARDPDLAAEAARVTAHEALATGVEWTFAPTLAVARDVRWGRTHESFSEDPAVAAAYAGRIVAALQDASDGSLGPDGVAACPKHWVGDGATRGGVDQGDARLSEEELLGVHALPYRRALEAGALSVMVSLSMWNGRRCHAHRHLIQGVLKGEMGFRGLVVSDWNGIDQVAEDYGEAVASAVNAGIDMFMVPERWRLFISTLTAQVESGAVAVGRIDDAVQRILRVKAACRLFDRPRPSERRWSNHSSFGSARHRAVARLAVQRSLVLLKNEGSILPLDPAAKILVAGKNAHDRGSQCGGFTVEWQGVRGNDRIEGGASVWEGVRAAAPNAVLSEDGSAAGAGRFSGGGFDVALVVVGERPYAEGMGDIRDPSPVRPGAPRTPGAAEPLRPYGQTLELSVLHPEDWAAIRAVRDQGVPVVVVLLSGRPLVTNRELAASSAFVAAWLPGSEGGGVADVLFGKQGFSGTLPFAWPAADPQGDDPPADILFPVGYGLRTK